MVPDAPAASAYPDPFPPIDVPTAAAMERLGEVLGDMLGPDEFVSLAGPLGAGKTTLVRGLAIGLGVVDRVSSPTFVIARRQCGARVDLLHCDLYRVTDIDEVIDLDLDSSGAVTVVEWGADAIAALTDDYLAVTIERSLGSGLAGRSFAAAGFGNDWPASRLTQLRNRLVDALDEHEEDQR